VPGQLPRRRPLRHALRPLSGAALAATGAAQACSHLKTHGDQALRRSHPQPLASALHSGDPVCYDLPQRLLDRLEPALHTLLDRAAAGGYARDDVTAWEVRTTTAFICQPVLGEQPGFNQRMTRVFIEGLDHVG
jgi:hypothetical protein